MDTGDINVLSNLSANIIDKAYDNIVLNAFRIAINGSLTQFNMVDGIVDEYEDESGINILDAFAHYKCNDNAASTVVTDDGSGANNAIGNVNTSNYSVAGKINEAFDFNGSTEFIDVDALQTDIASDTTGSISMWLKRTGAEAGAPLCFGDTNADRDFRIQFASGNINIGFDGGAATATWDIVTTGSPFTDGIYHHLVIVQDGIEYKIYIDGVNFTSFTRTVDSDRTAWFDNEAGLDNGRIGSLNRNNAGNSNFYGGQIDDFRYYQNKALTQTEVDTIFNSGSGTETTNLGSTNETYDSVNDLYSPSSPFISNASDFSEDMAVITEWAGADTNTGVHSQATFDSKSTAKFDTGANTNSVAAMFQNTLFTGTRNVVTVSIYLETVGTQANDDAFEIQLSDGTSIMVVSFASDGLFIFDGTIFNEVGTNLTIADTWQDWTFDINWTAQTVDVYLEGVLQESDVDSSLLGGTAGRVFLRQNGTNTANQISYVDFVLVGDDFEAPLDMTLISDVFTAEAQSDNARIVLFEEDVDSITLNTDLKAFVSRDGGTTFTQITLVNEGEYESGRNILSASVDISSQPAGTSMKYKIETLNEKNLKIHGTGLSWD